VALTLLLVLALLVLAGLAARPRWQADRRQRAVAEAHLEARHRIDAITHATLAQMRAAASGRDAPLQ
jgi:type II secretory pathway pseudopilin PulG